MMSQSKTDQTSAEFVEKSPSAKGNTGQTTVTNTQRLESASSGLSRVREAAKQDSKLQFNNLLHHVSIDLLRRSYFALKRDAAAGIDEVTWQEYVILVCLFVWYTIAAIRYIPSFIVTYIIKCNDEMSRGNRFNHLSLLNI